jgi:hypothetical protein
MTTKSQFIKHMENGGQIFRTTSRDKFFYKIKDGALMCRCNELGGWHPAVGRIKWDSDKLEIAELDYDYRYYSEPHLITKKLPSLEETTGGSKLNK